MRAALIARTREPPAADDQYVPNSKDRRAQPDCRERTRVDWQSNDRQHFGKLARREVVMSGIRVRFGLPTDCESCCGTCTPLTQASAGCPPLTTGKIRLTNKTICSTRPLRTGTNAKSGKRTIAIARSRGGTSLRALPDSIQELLVDRAQNSNLLMLEAAINAGCDLRR
jgi:hypothetical protein